MKTPNHTAKQQRKTATQNRNMINNSDYQEDFNYYKTLSLKDNKKSVEIEQYCTDEQYQKSCANCHAYGVKDANDKIKIPCAGCAKTGEINWKHYYTTGEIVHIPWTFENKKCYGTTMSGEIREQCLNEVITHAVYLGFTRVFDAEKNNYEEAYEYAKIFAPTIGNEIETFNEMYSEIFCDMFQEKFGESYNDFYQEGW